MFDWQELKRWGIAESRLPVGSEIRFRQASFWEQYRWQALLIALAFALETILIVGLWYEDRRRRTAETNGRALLQQLAHLNRARQQPANCRLQLRTRSGSRWEPLSPPAMPD